MDKDILHLNFYGVKVRVKSNDTSIIEDIRRDFSYFVSLTNENVEIEIFVHNTTPPYNIIPELKASLYGPNYIAYNNRDVRYVDYQGKLLSIYNFSKNIGEIYSLDKNLLHEIAYLLILSRVGEALDKAGIHRIHALGISIDGKAILCILPMGAGKTTLALELLKEEKVKLLSDDICLVTKKGEVLPFPLRIGIHQDANLSIPDQYLRDFTRSKYGPKTLIDIDYFKDRLSEKSKISAILIGERTTSNNSEIKRITKRKVILPLIINGVFGLGLPQLVEYFLRLNVRDYFKKFGIVFSRLLVSFKVIWKSKAYRFLIGKDKAKNTNTILAFLGLNKNL